MSDDTKKASPDPSAETVRVTIAAAWSSLLGSTPGSDDPTQTIRGSAPSAGSRGTATIKAHVLHAAGRDAIGEPDYELLEVLGEGGMGVVYRARQTSVDRPVAVKMLRQDRDDDEARDRFLQEALVTSALDHPNIIPVHDLGSDAEGALFFAMKQVGGRTWRSALRELPLAEHVEILLRVGDAVAFAHARGIIHRDLKPANIMIGDFGEVLVMDWGLAAALRADARGPRLDATTALGGTPAYLPPEVALGHVERIGVASDIYLLGACLWEVLTGRPPHLREGCRDALQAAAENRIAAAPDDEGELHALARWAMADDPQSRPATVRAFQQALRTWQSHVESHRLCALARSDFERAQVEADDRGFQRAQFGFEQALRLWDGNAAARTGLVTTRRTYAGTAARRGDLDLALALLNADDPADAVERGRVLAARTARARRHQQVRWLARTAALLVVGLLALAGWSYVSIGHERDRANQELTTRLQLEAQERARLAEILAEAEQRTAEGLAALVATDGDVESHLITAQQRFQRALFLRPDLTAASDGLRRAALAHATHARQHGQWRQAREKIALAEAVGLDADAAAAAYAAVAHAESQRQRELTTKVSAILADADAEQPRRSSDQARAALISLADPITADLLTARLAGPAGAARLLALHALPWMADAQAIPTLLAHIDAPADPDEQAAAIIGLCQIGGDDPGVFYALLSRLYSSARTPLSIWYRPVRGAWLDYARERIDAIAERDRNTRSPILPMHVAAAYQDLGQYRNAITWYEHSLGVNPTNNRPREAIFYCYLALGEYTTALRLTDVMLTTPGYPLGNARHARAQVQQALGDTSAAIAEAHLAVAAAPTSATLHAYLASILAERDPAEALLIIARARSLGAVEVVVDEVLVRAHLARGEFAPAMAALDRLVASEREQPRWLLLRALAHARRGDEAQARADLIEGTRRHPAAAAFPGMQAWLAARHGEADAVELLARARVRDATDGWAVAAAALVDANDATLTELNALADAADAPVEWRLQLAQAAAQRGDHAEAVRLADLACAQHPHWGWLRSQRALVHWTAGRREAALVDARAAVAGSAPDVRAWLNLAWMLHQIGERAEARQAADQAVQVRDHPPARLLRTAIAAERNEWADVVTDMRAVLPTTTLDREQRLRFAVALAATGERTLARAECRALLAEDFDIAVAQFAWYLAERDGDAAEAAALRASGVDDPEAATALYAPIIP